MIGIADLLIVLVMAADTVTGDSRKLIVDMTVDTENVLMRAAQLNPAGGDMIKNGITPLTFIMTGLAIGGKTEFGMSRIAGRLIILVMATVAGSGGRGKSLLMATITIQLAMFPVQLEDSVMIELGALPGDRRLAVTAFAVETEIGSRMGRIAGGLKITDVAALAIGR